MKKNLNCFLLGLTLVSGTALAASEPPATATTSTAAAAPTPNDIFNTESLCYELATRISAGDDDFLRHTIDYEAFLDRVLAGSPPAQRYSQAIRQGIMPSLHNISFNTHTRMRVAHFHQQGNDGDCLLVMAPNEQTTGQGIFTGHFILREEAEGPRVIDWENIGMTPMVSVMLGHFMNDIAHVSGMDGPRQDDAFKVLISFSQAIRSRDADRVAAAYAALPEPYHSDPSYIALAAILQKSSSSGYPALLDSLHNSVGNAPQYYGLLADFYIIHGDTTRTRSSMDSLSQAMDRTSAPEILSADLGLLQKDKKAFYSHLLRSLDDNPSEEIVYWKLFHYFAENNHYPDALLVIDALHQHYHYDFINHFNPTAKTQAFAASPEFATWKKAQQNKQAP